MKQKLHTILLIDDDSATNFINAHLLKMLGRAENVVVRENGKEALEYLLEGHKPDLIFLDINMPCMDGWEFLEEYKRMDNYVQGSIVIIMLTTSPLLEDRLKATATIDIAEFRNKPLSKEMLWDVLRKHFPALENA